MLRVAPTLLLRRDNIRRRWRCAGEALGVDGRALSQRDDASEARSAAD
jgi:hypothetical protein